MIARNGLQLGLGLSTRARSAGEVANSVPPIVLSMGAESGNMTGMGTVGGSVAASQVQKASGAWSYMFPNDPPTNRCTISSPLINSGFRMSLRLYPTSLSVVADNMISSSGVSSTFGLLTTPADATKLRLGVNNNAVSGLSAGAMLLNQWNLVVIQLANGDRGKAWLNGVLEIDFALGANNLSASTGLILFGFGGGDSYWDDIVVSLDPFDSSIDGMRVT